MLTYKDLTDEQRMVVDHSKTWYARQQKRRSLNNDVFSIVGPAGTGKSSILPALVERLGVDPDKVIVTAISGSAKNNIHKKFKTNIKSSTIASFLYKPVTVYKVQQQRKTVELKTTYQFHQYFKDAKLDKSLIKQWLDNFLNGNDQELRKQLLIINDALSKANHQTISLDVRFEPKTAVDLAGQFDLIIVDEAGMITNKQLRLLMDLKIPIILTGDADQIGPIVNDSSKHDDRQNWAITDTTSTYHHSLTQIIRQAQNNPINQLGNAIRQGHDLSTTYKDTITPNGSIHIRNKASADDGFWPTMFQFALSYVPQQKFIILAHTNDHVTLANLYAHKELSQNYTHKQQVYEGEPLTITYNDAKNAAVTNGTQIVVRSIHYECPFYIIADIEIDGNIEYNVAINTYQIHNTYINPNFTERTAYNQTIKEYNIMYNQYFDWRQLYEYKRNVIEYLATGTCADDKLSESSMLIFATYGYAMTIHKAQGKEWPMVCLLASRHYTQWTNIERDVRRLYYTAVTRCKDALYIVEPTLAYTLE